jgi:hypothetical protein
MQTITADSLRARIPLKDIYYIETAGHHRKMKAFAGPPS